MFASESCSGVGSSSFNGFCPCFCLNSLNRLANCACFRLFTGAEGWGSDGLSIDNTIHDAKSGVVKSLPVIVDESIFDDPFTFDIDRKRIPSLTFGTGPHICLGQHLARMEMRVLWEELLPQIADVRLNGTPRRTISNFVCGPKDVPIALRWEEAAAKQVHDAVLA